MNPIAIQGNLKNNDFWKCGLCQNYCRVTTSCKQKEIITMNNRCFWEELPMGISIYKDDKIIEYLSVTITVGPHQAAPYGYWRHTNNATGKEIIFLNTASNNFLVIIILVIL
jgi:hypothetical protein